LTCLLIVVRSAPGISLLSVVADGTLAFCPPGGATVWVAGLGVASGAGSAGLGGAGGGVGGGFFCWITTDGAEGGSSPLWATNVAANRVKPARIPTKQVFPSRSIDSHYSRYVAAEGVPRFRKNSCNWSEMGLSNFNACPVRGCENSISAECKKLRASERVESV